MENITKEQLETAVKKYQARAPILREFGWYDNGKTRQKLKNLIEKYDVDISHFDYKKHLATVNQKYKRIKKVCPVCTQTFEVLQNHPREKITCSYSCSNTYFRSGKNNPNWKTPDSRSQTTKHRVVCFLHHEKKCAICGEEKIVAVHHYDKNNKNNAPENLIPLCPTHHQYVHSRYVGEVLPSIIEYREKFILKHKVRIDSSDD